MLIQEGALELEAVEFLKAERNVAARIQGSALALLYTDNNKQQMFMSVTYCVK